MRFGGFEPLSFSDYPGMTAAVVFTQGCNWRCPYCHNRPLLPLVGEGELSKEYILRSLEKLHHLLGGVVITGGEPTLHRDLGEFIAELKQTGLKVKLDTNGSNPGFLEELFAEGNIDYLAMDIKAPWKKYGVLTGRDRVDLDAVRQSVTLIAASGIPFHFRTTCDLKYLDDSDIELIRKNLPPNASFVVQKCNDISSENQH